jgi:type IV secretion system protein VirD4
MGLFGTEADARQHMGDAETGIYFGRYFDDAHKRAAPDPLVYSNERHALLFGPTGCGKTSRFLQANLLRDNLKDRSVIVLDPKAECCAVSAQYRHKILKHNVAILDPFGKMKEIADSNPTVYRYLIDNGLTESTGFNPLQHLATGDNFYDDAAGIGEALIKINERDSHWTESAQGLLVGLLMWEKLRYGAAANLRNIRLMLTESEKKEITENETGTKVEVLTAGLRSYVQDALVKGEAATASEAERIAASLLSRFNLDNKEIQGIRSTADTQTRWMLSPPMQADLSKPGIDFATLKTAAKPTTVFVILPAERMRTHSVWLRLVIVSALRSLYQPGGRKTVIFADEMPALGYLAPLADAFGLVRGYGVTIIGISQDLNQLKSLYKEHWESFVANAGCIMAFTPNDLTTADWMSRRAGQITARSTTINKTPQDKIEANSARDKVSLGSSQVSRPLYLTQELFGLDEGTGLLFIAGLPDSVRFFAPLYIDITTCLVHALENPFYATRL